jgi:hypothetical protein
MNKEWFGRRQIFHDSEYCPGIRLQKQEYKNGVAGGHIVIQTGGPCHLHLSIEWPALRLHTRSYTYSIEHQNDCYRKLHQVETSDRQCEGLPQAE